jgi:hypothetical protein
MIRRDRPKSPRGNERLKMLCLKVSPYPVRHEDVAYAANRLQV